MNEHVARFIYHRATPIIAAGVGSFVMGAVGGYILGRYRTEKRYDDTTPVTGFDEDDIRAQFNLREAMEEKASEPRIRRHPLIVEETAYEGREEIQRQLRSVPTDSEPEEAVVANNVFAGPDDEWDYDKELKGRNKNLPYVIHKDEFFAEDPAYELFTQFQLTYYAGDEMMVDEQNAPVYNFTEVVGPLLFGHGSGDADLFYVRNERNKAEYEVSFDPSMYAVEVLGLEAEEAAQADDVKHSNRTRFRPE